jgi:hypothetical protein
MFSDVVSYAMLADFELLKHSRGDILNKPWVKPANRLIATKFFKIQRAWEEIERLNVETQWLHTWLEDEDAHLFRIASEVTERDACLGAELQERYWARKRINDDHRKVLKTLYNLSGFSGKCGRGTRLGHMDVPPTSSSQSLTFSSSQAGFIPSDACEDQEIDIMEDDELNEQVLALGEFLESRHL